MGRYSDSSISRTLDRFRREGRKRQPEKILNFWTNGHASTTETLAAGDSGFTQIYLPQSVDVRYIALGVAGAGSLQASARLYRVESTLTTTTTPGVFVRRSLTLEALSVVGSQTVSLALADAVYLDLGQNIRLHAQTPYFVGVYAGGVSAAVASISTNTSAMLNRTVEKTTDLSTEVILSTEGSPAPNTFKVDLYSEKGFQDLFWA